jgi:hypothetical protein
VDRPGVPAITVALTHSLAIACSHTHPPLRHGTQAAMGFAMHRHVEQLIGRLATDAELRDRFAEQPFEALREQRLELTDVELAALAATDPNAFRALSEALDRRLRKAPPAAERPARHTTTTGFEPTKETP